jgi:hypothetical protein
VKVKIGTESCAARGLRLFQYSVFGCCCSVLVSVLWNLGNKVFLEPCLKRSRSLDSEFYLRSEHSSDKALLWSKKQKRKITLLLCQKEFFFVYLWCDYFTKRENGPLFTTNNICRESVCCLLVLDSVTSTPQWIRRAKPRGCVHDMCVFVCECVLGRSRVSQPLNLRLCLLQHFGFKLCSLTSPRAMKTRSRFHLSSATDRLETR